MGARTFESDLRRRLLAFVVPIALGGALAAVGVTWFALDAADTALARAKASTALSALDAELAEGDPPSEAAEEVLNGFDSEGARVSIVHTLVERSTVSPPPSAMMRLAPGSCTVTWDRTEIWRGCRVTRGSATAIAAICVTPHVQVVRTLAVAMALVVVLAALATVIATRRAMHGPIADVARLARWSEHVSTVDRPEAPPPVGTEELARLASSLASLVDRLHDAFDRERETSAYLAHELRTPLTAMRAELEAAGGPMSARLIADVDQLARAIDAILMLAEPIATDPKEIVNVADLARRLAPADAVVDAPDEALVDADERLIELALTNLLENAIEHGGTAANAIRVAREGHGVRLSVEDGGVGVSDDLLARMFEPHVRGDRSGGRGLGLAFVRAVALRYGGAVEAKRSTDGNGLVIAMTFGRLVAWEA